MDSWPAAASGKVARLAALVFRIVLMGLTSPQVRRCSRPVALDFPEPVLSTLAGERLTSGSVQSRAYREVQPRASRAGTDLDSRLMEATPRAKGASISAIVLTYRRQDRLQACLDSIAAALAGVDGLTKMVVVDNGSESNAASTLVARMAPAATVVTLRRNQGYAGGLNAGLEQSSAQWVLCVGDDATMEPDAVAQMLQAGSDSPDIGSVAACMLFADSSAGGRINSAGLEIDCLGIAYDRLLGAPREDGETLPTEVFGTSGGAALYRREMLEETGGFDDSFHLYLEDADLAWRARAHGWRCIYQPRAVVHHHHSQTSRHRSDYKYFYVGRNRVRMLAKNATTAQLLRYAPLMVLYDLGYVAFAMIADHSTAPLRGRVEGLKEWRRYRSLGTLRASLKLSPVRGVRAALRRNAAWKHGS